MLDSVGWDASSVKTRKGAVGYPTVSLILRPEGGVDVATSGVAQQTASLEVRLKHTGVENLPCQQPGEEAGIHLPLTRQ